MLRNSMLALGLIAIVCTPLLSQTKAEAEAWVKKGVAFAQANGKDKLIAEINAQTPTFKKGELYLFVLDDKYATLAHGGNTKLVGKDMSQARDPDGVFFLVELVKIGKAKGKGWVDYKFINPETKAIEPKTSYVEKFQDVYIGCGIYKK